MGGGTGRLPGRDVKWDEGPMLETLDYSIRIGSTPAFLYFDLYLYSAYAAHYVYLAMHVYISYLSRSVNMERMFNLINTE